LLDLGFGKEQCVEALRSTHGDANLAADRLIAATRSDPREGLRERLLSDPSGLEEAIRAFEEASPDEEGALFGSTPRSSSPSLSWTLTLRSRRCPSAAGTRVSKQHFQIREFLI
jgi:hypothetical protein